MVNPPKPHHLEGEGLLVEIAWGAKAYGQIDLPEQLDSLVWRNAVKR
jgi:hypothetical protein